MPQSAEISNRRVFLSHSVNDKPFVRRVHKDLKAAGFDLWLDENDIPFGGSIAGAINDGLDSSAILVVFLSRMSMSSRWVQMEWQAKFFRDMKSERVRIIPLLLDDCSLPSLLQNQPSIDFTDLAQYETSLANLIRGLRQIIEGDEGSHGPANYASILEMTIDFLEELEGEVVSVPFKSKVPLIGTLKKLPRSGKLVRLKNFKPRIKVRSIYDHVLSVAHLADCLVPILEHKLQKSELPELARCIAFHELNEVVLGDIPDYTSLSDAGRQTTKNFAEQRLRSVPPKERERIANEFVWLFLNEKHRTSLETVRRVVEDRQSRLYRVFKMLDKIDPIFATWRYLHHYRGKLGDDPRAFNKKMKNFFDNPNVRAFLLSAEFEHRIVEMVGGLQDRRNAWGYYEDPRRPFVDCTLFGVAGAVVRNCIEGIGLFYDGE